MAARPTRKRHPRHNRQNGSLCGGSVPDRHVARSAVVQLNVRPAPLLRDREWAHVSIEAIVSVELYALPALSSLNRWKGRRRAAFSRKLGFSNPVLTRAAKAHQREEQLKRTDRNRVGQSGGD